MNETKPDTLQQSAETAKPTGIARRRLLRAGLAAAPVVLAVSGRSAMAAGDCAKGLSPMAWSSLAPDGTNCRMNSHTVEVNPLGKPISYWQAKVNSDANFGKIKFNTVFPSSNNTNLMRAIITNTTSNVNDYYCVAYFNTQLLGGSYALTLTELKALNETGKLTPGGTALSNSQIQAFLAQTWG